MLRPGTSPRRRHRAVAALVAAAALGAVVPLPAAADPVGDTRAQAERVARRLDELGRQTSLLTEQMNNARLRAGAVEAEARAARRELERVESRMRAARDTMRLQAVETYVRNDHVLTLATFTVDAAEMARRRGYVEALVGRHREALEQLRAARADLHAGRAELERAQQAAQAAVASVQAAREAAAASAEAERATLARVQGELAALVEADRRRRAEEEERRARAELAARQAREEAAVRHAREEQATRQAREEAGRRAREEAARRATRDRPAPAQPDRRPPAPTPAPRGDTEDEARPRSPAAGAGAAVAEARRQIGKPYEWGAEGPDSFDCSGLTLWAWRAGGRSLPHSSQAQYASTARVALGEIQPGDLLFYGSPIHHVGIYVGDGQMIEASQTGTPVRYASIHRRDLVGVGRVR